MNCPACHVLICEATAKVLDSRPSSESAIRRRRECKQCGARFTTREEIVDDRSGKHQRKILADVRASMMPGLSL